MAGEITLQQMFQTPVITRVVSRIKTPLSLFQQFLGQMPGQGASESVSGRHIGWDLFDRTRTIAKGRAPGSGPATAHPKRVGHVSAVAYRAHEKIPLLREKIFRTRAPGAQFGQIDTSGQRYIALQTQFLTQRFRNNREFMVSRMFRGGFSVTFDGEDWIPGELTAGTFDIDMQLDAGHKSTAVPGLQLGTGADIIDAAWSTAGTEVISHINNINAALERENGRPLRHIWINTGVYNNLLNNSGLQTIGGSAFRVFESLSAREARSSEGIADSGYDVVFRALPLQTFHIYDGVLATEEFPIGGDQTTTANTSLLVADDHAIFMPNPDPSWQGFVEGSEWIAENWLDMGRETFGFHAWTTPSIDPAALELKMIDNGLPALYVPKATAYATVQ